MRNFIGKHNIWIFPILNIVILPFVAAKLQDLGWYPQDWAALSKRNVAIYLLYFVLLIACVLNIYFTNTKYYIKRMKSELSFYKNIADLMTQSIQVCIHKSLLDSADRLGLKNEKTHEDRLTIFGIKYNKGSSFFVLDRYSENPIYRNIRSKEYPLNKGCISKGYQNDWHFEKGCFPSFEKDKNGYGDYIRKNYNYNHSDIRNLNMKSRFYAVKRIKRKNEKELGVIVFESMRPNRFQEDQIKSELSRLAEEAYDFLKVLDLKAEKVSQEIDIEINRK